MRVFGIDPGSLRTGYGCIDSNGRRHQLVACGAIQPPAKSSLPERLGRIYAELDRLIAGASPDCIVVENLFHARNVRSALTLGHARGVAVLAAVRAGVEVVEYTPAEIKASVAGYGRADKVQIQHMVKQLLGLAAVPRPYDAADALAVALCHIHAHGPIATLASAAARAPRHLRSWRHVTVDQLPRRRVE